MVAVKSILATSDGWMGPSIVNPARAKERGMPTKPPATTLQAFQEQNVKDDDWLGTACQEVDLTQFSGICGRRQYKITSGHRCSAGHWNGASAPISGIPTFDGPAVTPTQALLKAAHSPRWISTEMLARNEAAARNNEPLPFPKATANGIVDEYRPKDGVMPRLSPGDVKIGDVVFLISGGPKMTVESILDIRETVQIPKGSPKGTKPTSKVVDQSVDCVWFPPLPGGGWGEFQRATFRLSLLDSEV